jgi:cellulose synthase/poly-beta-1,6-N-acetylglucosamine synthase-like glycosyltransferase
MEGLHEHEAICMSVDLTHLGAVIIGRNEEDHLPRCLASMAKHCSNIVYVDSGSTDSSVSLATETGCEVVELDMSVPFSAARARNAGLERIRTAYPHVQLVQFIDGDCEVADDWLPQAASALQQQSDLGVVCGRRRERHPAASIYNRLCDVEWDTPVGKANACGGDFMVKMAAIFEAGGFNPTVIAGEEPELCYRLRKAGWTIERLDLEMTLHDAAMSRFSEWWHRSRRSGYAYALVSWLHRQDQERMWARETVSILTWGLAIPVTLTLLSVLVSPLYLSGFALYPLLAFKIYVSLRTKRKLASRIAASYAVACVIAKFAQIVGVICCWRDLTFRRERTIIEYRSS